MTMRSRWLVALLCLLIAPTFALASSADLDDVLEGLAGSQSKGRSTDTDLDQAAQFLTLRLQATGLDLIEQRFEGPDGSTLRNLVVLREGSKPDAGWVVIGAHYDHLGLGEAGTPNHGQVHFGADDNASGCAILATMIERWRRDDWLGDNERSVAYVFFSGEEIGLLGSRHFTAHPPMPIESVQAMINLDTVGRLSDGGLTVFGVESSNGFAPMLEGLNSQFGFDLKPVARSSGASDDMAFAEKGIATLHLFTGAHATYHRPSDTLETIDRDGLEAIVEFTGELLDFMSFADTDINFVPAGAQSALADPKRATAGRRRVSLGTIPDFQGTGPGVKITGVIPGSPAAGAGLHEGDVIVGFGGAPIDDLTDYSEALKRYAPGDEVEIEYRREGEQRQATVVLVARR